MPWWVEQLNWYTLVCSNRSSHGFRIFFNEKQTKREKVELSFQVFGELFITQSAMHGVREPLEYPQSEWIHSADVNKCFFGDK